MNHMNIKKVLNYSLISLLITLADSSMTYSWFFGVEESKEIKDIINMENK